MRGAGAPDLCTLTPYISHLTVPIFLFAVVWRSYTEISITRWTRNNIQFWYPLSGNIFCNKAAQPPTQHCNTVQTAKRMGGTGIHFWFRWRDGLCIKLGGEVLSKNRYRYPPGQRGCRDSYQLKTYNDTQILSGYITALIRVPEMVWFIFRSIKCKQKITFLYMQTFFHCTTTDSNAHID